MPSGQLLYIDADLRPSEPTQFRVLSGIERFAGSFGWTVLSVSREQAPPESIRTLLNEHRPVGCIVNAYRGDHIYPPRLFEGFQVVYFDPPSAGWLKGVPVVVNDDLSIARAAFRELSAGLPECYAAVPSESMLRWTTVRIEEFSALCSSAGFKCRVFPGRKAEAQESRHARLVAFFRSMPRKKCAVFSTNDNAARDAWRALAEAGRSVPRDATVIGVDGTAVSNDQLTPLLSSIKIDFEQGGYIAAKLLATGTAGLDGGVVSMPPLLVLRRESTRGRGRREPRVLDAVDIIRREACSGLTARSLVARFRGSRNLFERRFREAMGHSVLDEILHVRLERVQAFLMRPDVAIGAIAARCGFGSDIELRRLFRARFGMSMRQWRRTYMP